MVTLTNKFSGRLKRLYGSLLLLLMLILSSNLFALIQPAQSGNWNNPLTWVGGIVPSPTDDVNITNFYTITLDVPATINNLWMTSGILQGSEMLVVSANLTMSGGNVNLLGTLSILGNLSLSGGNLGGGAGTSAINVEDNFIFSGGSLGASVNSTGTLTVNGSTQIISGQVKYCYGKDLIINNVGTLSASDPLYIGANGKITVASGASWSVDLSSPKTINFIAANGIAIIDNQGTINLDGASAFTFGNHTELINNGLINVNGGELKLSTTTNQPGAIYHLAEGSILNFGYGTTTGLHADMIDAQGNWTLIISEAVVNVTGGIFNLTGYNQTSGILQGTADVNIIGNAAVSGGSYNIVGTTNISGNATISNNGIFDGGTGTRTINITGNLSLSNNGNMGAGNGVSTTTVGGNFTFSGGHLGSSVNTSGTVTVNGTTDIIAGQLKYVIGKTLIMNNGGTYPAGEQLYIGLNGKLMVSAGTTFSIDLSSPVTFTNGMGGVGTVENQGTITLNGTSLMSFANQTELINNGHIHVSGGELRLATTLHQSGALYHVAEGSTLNFGYGTTTGLHGDMIDAPGNWTLTISGAVVNVTGGVFNLTGYNHSSGVLQGTADVNIIGNANISGGSFNVVGTTNIYGNATISNNGIFDGGTGTRTINITGNLSLSNNGNMGTGNGVSTTTVGGNFTFSGGHLGSSINTTGTVTVNGTTNIIADQLKYIIGKTLIMNNGGSYAEGEQLYIGMNGKLTVSAGSTFNIDLASPVTFTNGMGGVGTIENQGTIILNGTSLMSFAPQTELINNGHINVSGGELRLATTTHQSGAGYHLAEGSTLNFGYGTTTGLHGDMIDAPGNWTLTISGAVVNVTGGVFSLTGYNHSSGILQGTADVNIIGNAVVSGGSYNIVGNTHISGNATISNNGIFDGGTGTRTINITGNLSLSNNGNMGTGNGVSTTTVGGNFAFSGGHLGSSLNTTGAITVNGTTNIIAGQTKYVVGKTLLMTNGGTYSAGEQLYIGQNGKLTVVNSTTFNIDLSSPVTFFNGMGGIGTIENKGTIIISGASLCTLVNSVNLVNNGLIINTGGELKLAATTNTGTIKGVGTINFFNGTLTQNGTISPGMSPGILTVIGSQPLTALSTLEIGMFDGNGPGVGHSQLQRNSNLTLNGLLRVHETCNVPNGTYVIVQLTSGTISGNFTSYDLPAGYQVNVGTNSVSVTRNVPDIFCPADLVIDAPDGDCSVVVNNIDPLVEGNQAITWTMTGATIASGTSTASGQVFNSGVTFVTYNLSQFLCQTCTFTVTVNSNVSPTVTLQASNTDICQGETVYFTAIPESGGIPSYQWKLNGVNVGNNSPEYESSTLEHGDVITVQMNSSLFCANPATVTSDPVIINISPNIIPEVSIIATDDNICEGTKVVFTATPINGGVPSFQWKLNGEDVGDGSPVYENSTLQNGDQVQALLISGLPCAINPATSEPITMTVHPVPLTQITGNTLICQGESTVLTAGYGASWLWNTGEITQSITVSASGIYSVVVTDANGCDAFAELLVTGYPLPQVEITGNLSFCYAASTTLTATTGVFWLWNTGETTQSIVVDMAGLYFVWVTDTHGCVGYAQVSVTNEDNEYPTIIAPDDLMVSAEEDLCSASDIILGEPITGDDCFVASVTNNAPAIFPVGITTVTWTVTDLAGKSTQDVQLVTVVDHQPPTITAPVDLNIPVDAVGTSCSASNIQLGNPIINDNCSLATLENNAPVTFQTGITLVTWTVTDNSGNQSQAVQKVTVFSDFVAEISGDLEFCQGQSTLLTATEGVTYLWSTGETTQSITVSASGVFSVVVTAASGCESYTEISVTAWPAPAVQISGETSLCEGEYTVLSATGGSTYSWNTGESTQSITVAQEGDYSVTVANANGCTGSAGVHVTVNTLPLVSITPAGPTTFCYGGSVQLTAFGGNSYLWNTGETSQSIVAFESGTYSVTGFNVSGCEESAEVVVEVIALPEVICPPTQLAIPDDLPVLLNQATPAGGFYYGTGVTYNGADYYFDPGVGIGSYNISYCYTNPETGCENCCSFIFSVTPLGQDICIPQGWSGISSYFQPDIPIDEIFAQLITENKIQIMIGKDGIFWPSQNINTLSDWNVYNGYKIKMNAEGCIDITGTIPNNKTVHLDKGSQFLPVLCSEPVDAFEIFQQLGNNLIFAFDLYSQRIYWPAGRLFTLDVLEPGVGYLVTMMNPGEVTFNCGSKSAFENYIKAQPPVYENSPWQVNPTGNSHFISIDEKVLATLQKGDFIGTFNNTGICVGLTQIDNNLSNQLIVVYGDDPTTSNTDGLIHGEAMNFRIFHTLAKYESEVEVLYDDLMPDSGNFTENGQSKIINIKTGTTGLFEGKPGKIRLYPNPGNGFFNLSLPAMESVILVEITNTGGQIIKTERFFNRDFDTIQHLDMTGFNPGVYLIRITAGAQTEVKKAVIE